MELTLQTFLIVCPLVFLGGFVDSVAGGAGIITIPAYLMAGIPVHLAAGTNKLVNGSGTLVATLKYIKSGKVVWRPALLAGVISEAALQALLLIALPCVAVFLTIRKDFGKETPEEQKVTVSSAREALSACLIGLVFGCYDGLLGPGTGTFMIMGFTAFLSMDLITASGCSKVSNLASNIASAAVWVLHGQVLWMLALPAVCCSIIGNYLGAQYAIRGGSKKIRNMMFVVLALLFIKMAYELLF